MTRRAIQVLAYPAIFGGAAATLIALASRGIAYWPAFPLIVAAGLIAVALLERRVPYEPAWNRNHGDLLADVLHNLANHGLIQLTVAGSFLLRSVWMPEPRLWPAQAAVGAGAGSGRGAQPEPLRNALLASR